MGKSKSLRAYQRRTVVADALIASAYLAGTNTRRVRRALAALFGGAVSKDTVSRVWRKVKGDWEAWNARSLADRGSRPTGSCGFACAKCPLPIVQMALGFDLAMAIRLPLSVPDFSIWKNIVEICGHPDHHPPYDVGDPCALREDRGLTGSARRQLCRKGLIVEFDPDRKRQSLNVDR